ncbi:glycosyltransferase [Prosthecomicrobium sp. N25]|uniref:glycosyltransferase n=1 Tax=Prosthecomicrobium sp. N25 TaxID=3129254 RepID=UPI0030773C01
MSAAAGHRDPVPPVAPGVPRPRWSVMIPAYRSARTIGATLESVLAQAPGPDEMQIEVVDDGSGDEAERIVRALGRGRVGFRAHDSNLGHIRTFHDCLLAARGQLVHLLHADDLVRPGFYAALGAAFEACPDLGAAYCRAVYVDEAGRELGMVPEAFPAAGPIPDAAAFLAAEQRIMTPAIVVRRAAYEALGGFDRRFDCAEDWEMWVRIAASYPIWYEPRPLALYRMHPDSNTGRHVRSAADAAANRLAISVISGYLPPDRAGAVARSARRTYASSAIDSAAALLRAGDPGAALAQAREALRLSPAAALRRAVRILASRGTPVARRS